MAAPAGRHLSGLIRRLEADPAGFEFFQAVRLLEEAAPLSQIHRDSLNAKVRLRSAPELSFPAADLRRASRSEDGTLALELNFLGLYGVDAPLPSYFGETVARCDEDGERLRAFLDLFGSRLYELFYLAWKKNRAHQMQAEGNIFEKYLRAISGSRAMARSDLAMSFAGALGSRVKSAAGLAGILRERFGAPVRVVQFVPCWVQIDGTSPLGNAGPVLGDSAVIGERVLDSGRKIRIEFGPLTMEQAMPLFPGQGASVELMSLVRSYLEPTMEFEFIFRVECRKHATELKGNQVRLGWTAALGKAEGVQIIRLSASTYSPNQETRQ